MSPEEQQQFINNPQQDEADQFPALFAVQHQLHSEYNLIVPNATK